MAKIGLPKRSGKRLKVREKSVNFKMHIEWQPCGKERVKCRCLKFVFVRHKCFVFLA